ncbi:TPA: hypothetical protein ON570_002114 [Citrobacter werkmanii]|nr:hypothetical protein [Citrobacter werkmanii]
MKQQQKKSERIFRKAAGVLLVSVVLGESVQAAEVFSTPSQLVTGHAPTLVAGQLTVDDVNGNGQIDDGDTFKIDPAHDFTFADSDGDTSLANTYSWKINGTEVGTADTYTIKTADLGKTLSLDVTPHTDPTITVPADGAPVTVSTRLARISKVSINGYDFPVRVLSSAVPGKGFTGGTFTLVVEGANVADYTWKTDRSEFISVANGQVHLDRIPSTLPVVVNIIAEPKTGGGLPLRYAFKIDTWFVNSGNETRHGTAEAKVYCEGRNDGGFGWRLANSSHVVNAFVGMVVSYDQRGTDSLYGEWGNLTVYPKAGFRTGSYWAPVLTGSPGMPPPPASQWNADYGVMDGYLSAAWPTTATPGMDYPMVCETTQ